MFKKYLPFIFLIASALLLFVIKKNQRGESDKIPATEQTENRINVPAILPGYNRSDDMKTQQSAQAGPGRKELVEPGFDRNTSRLIFSKHAKCRMECRKISEAEVKEILKNGTLNHKKIQSDKRGKTYPVEGYTVDKQHVRIVFAPKDNALVVVTVIDLDTEWKCNCK